MRLRNSSGSGTQGFFCNLDEILSFHSSPSETIRGRSLRVAVVCVFIIVTFFAVAFVFLVFFLVGLLSKEDIGLRRAIRKVLVEALREYSAHVHMVLCARWREQRVWVVGG